MDENNLSKYLNRKRAERGETINEVPEYKQPEYKASEYEAEYEQPVSKPRRRARWVLISIVGVLLLALVTNISNREFQEQTSQELGYCIGKTLENYDYGDGEFAVVSRILLSKLSDLVTPNYLDIKIENYYIFSLAYVKPSKTLYKTLIKNKGYQSVEIESEYRLIGFSVFGRTFYPILESKLEQYLEEIVENDSEE